jgi:S1-C subfamily serine protease
VAPNQILCSRHLLLGAESLTVKVPGGRAVEARVIGEDATNDLALLESAAGFSGFPPEWAEQPLGSSEPLVIAGYAEGRHLLRVEGRVAAVEVALPTSGTELLALAAVDASVFPGMSGGPVLDVSGRTAGVLVGREVFEPSSIAYVLPAARVRDSLQRMVHDGCAGRLSFLLFGIDLAEGFLVERTTSDTPAEFRVGDVVLSVDGMAVGVEARRPFVGMLQAKRHRLRIHRLGSTLDIEATPQREPPTCPQMQRVNWTFKDMPGGAMATSAPAAALDQDGAQLLGVTVVRATGLADPTAAQLQALMNDAQRGPVTWVVLQGTGEVAYRIPEPAIAF